MAASQMRRIEATDVRLMRPLGKDDVIRYEIMKSDMTRKLKALQ